MSKKQNSNTLLIVLIVLVAVLLAAVIALGILVVRKGKTDEKKNTANNNEQAVVMQENEGLEEVKENASEEEIIDADPSQKESSPADIPMSEWCRAYAEYLNNSEYEGFAGYGLVYVDEDDIPELICMGDCEAAGNIFVTYKGNGQSLHTHCY